MCHDAVETRGTAVDPYPAKQDNELKARVARNKGILVRQSLWSFNWCEVTRVPWKLVVVPAITYGNAVLYLSSEAREFAQRCQQ